MKIPMWVQPAVLGGIVGGILTMLVGFNGIGWKTEDSADRQAYDQSRRAVIEALVPICLSQQKNDPNAAAKLTEMASMSNAYQQRDFVISAGWATMPQATEPNRDVALLCAETLVKPPQG